MEGWNDTGVMLGVGAEQVLQQPYQHRLEKFPKKETAT
jgi:hypothetical protein